MDSLDERWLLDPEPPELNPSAVQFVALLLFNSLRIFCMSGILSDCSAIRDSVEEALAAKWLMASWV